MRAGRPLSDGGADLIVRTDANGWGVHAGRGQGARPFDLGEGAAPYRSVRSVSEHTFVLDSNRKGAIAEAEVTAAAVRLGVPAFAPVAEHGRADLVLEIGGRLWRVQCKWGQCDATHAVIVVRVGGSRFTPRGYVSSTYSVQEVDLFGIYCDALDRVFLDPVAVVAGKRLLHLRVAAPRNNQRACISIAENFAFEGAVAQLAERSAGSRKVRGSNPLSSIASTEPVTVGSDTFRTGLGEWIERVASGEEVPVTRRGRPVMRALPVRADGVGDGESLDASLRAAQPAAPAVMSVPGPPPAPPADRAPSLHRPELRS